MREQESLTSCAVSGPATQISCVNMSFLRIAATLNLLMIKHNKTMLLHQIMCQSDYAEQDENNNVIRRQVDLYLGLVAQARRSKDLVLVDAVNATVAFWKRYSTQLPWAAALARKVLLLPATSATAKRVFSSAGLIVTAEFGVGSILCKQTYFYT